MSLTASTMSAIAAGTTETATGTSVTAMSFVLGNEQNWALRDANRNCIFGNGSRKLVIIIQ